jgi:hypothetical protein
MQYFLVVQDSLGGIEPAFEGPFESIEDAKSAALGYDLTVEGFFTILSQDLDDATFKQVDQALENETVTIDVPKWSE